MLSGKHGVGQMESTKDELGGLRGFLAALESNETVYRRNGVDIKPREIEVLKREIAHLESVLERAKSNHA
jgi:polyhydroxyalkanoate synthesis regulator phasin